MTPGERQDVLVVIRRAGGTSSGTDEQRLRLPHDADVPELLRELKRQSPTMYAEIRRRILQSAGQVLAYGKDDPLLPELTKQLASGGPIVFPADDESPQARRTAAATPDDT